MEQFASGRRLAFSFGGQCVLSYALLGIVSKFVSFQSRVLDWIQVLSSLLSPSFVYEAMPWLVFLILFSLLLFQLFFWSSFFSDADAYQNASIIRSACQINHSLNPMISAWIENERRSPGSACVHRSIDRSVPVVSAPLRFRPLFDRGTNTDSVLFIHAQITSHWRLYRLSMNLQKHGPTRIDQHCPIWVEPEWSGEQKIRSSLR